MEGENLDQFLSAPELRETSDGYESGEYAINDAAHAFEVAERIFDDAENNIRFAAKIRNKLDGTTPPYDPATQKEKGKGHKSNIPFGILRNNLNKVPPVFYGILNTARYLINNRLPDYDPDTDRRIDNAYGKSQHVMEVFTDTLKRWERFFPFVVGLANEYTRAGHCFAGFVNEKEWRPELWRMDKCQVPRGTEVMATDIPAAAVKKEYYIHDLFEQIRDKEDAEEIGWNIENVVDAINDAKELCQPDASDHSSYLEYEDLLREVTPSSAYMKGTKRIPVYIVFVKEYNGSVSQFIFHRDTKKPLFEARERFGTMGDAVVAFAFEWGDGTIHGAQSPGHTLYDLSCGAEKAANSVVDNLRNRSKFVVRHDSAAEMAKSRTIINDDVVHQVGGTFQGNMAALPDATSAWGNMYDFFRGVIGEDIGAFLPPDIQSRFQDGEAATATQVTVAAQRQNEYREAVLEWFLKHWGNLSFAIARRLFDPNSTDDEAIRARKRVLTKLTEEELNLWLKQKPISSIAEYTELKNQKLAQFAAAHIGNPSYNQRKLEALKVTATIGGEWVDELIIPEEDQSVVQEAVRMQQLELALLRTGMNVPVVPRDNDIYHLQVLRGTPDQNFADGVLMAMLQEGNPEALQAAFKHYGDHVTQAESKGLLGEQMNIEKQFTAQFKKLYDHIVSSGQDAQNMEVIEA